ncbi:PREDICTED: E3 ubiquitin-protein ligase RHA1B-like [Brassica oleracea var. oleracea]|uniref:E3 ubiquitin-protein ligase RHA1B-like n=1 Tax=Brassica oleracea var. oleracea TaxID=109376 RepID=UPI0006A6B8A4|nr:PREDICTED: E3 ubiquitin-protein ligase RHA1B-like [Brassica oleracea var. oleracea]
MKTASNGHLIHETVCDMEYMLGYHEIDFDSVMEIIEQTSDFVAHTIPTLDDPTNIDLDIIVKISDHNLAAFRRIDLDVYIIELRENQREPTPSEKDDICPICCEEFVTEGEINSLNCKHSYHHHCILDWIGKTLTCPCCRAILA